MSLFEKDNKFFISDSAYVFSVNDEKNISFPEHRHDFVEMVYMLKGKCTHIINKKEYPAKRGDLVIINYNQTHAIENSEEISYINILMKPEYISNSLTNHDNAFALLHLSEFEDFRKILNENKCRVSFSGSERKRIESIIEAIIKEMKEKKAGYELLIRSELNILITIVFRKMSLDLEFSFDGISEKLLSYIELHCSEKLTLESIAKMCSYAPAYFSRVFKNYTGQNFTSYLKKARIEKAANLLLTTDSKITDIVYLVGYSDKTKFFSHFKSIMGTSPLKYRKGQK